MTGLLAACDPAPQSWRPQLSLFDLCFFVNHVLANSWIVLLGFHLFRMQALVLGHCVVVARSGAGNQFDFVTHCSILPRLNALTAGTQIGNDLLDTMLVNDSQALVRDAQTYESLLCFEPKALVLQVWQEAATSFIVCVRNVIARLRPFPRHLAYLGHG